MTHRERSKVMPLQRIDLLVGRTPSARRAIADAIHQSLVEALGVPEKDRFQIITQHERDGLLFAPEYLGVPHENPVLVQITLTPAT